MLNPIRLTVGEIAANCYLCGKAVIDPGDDAETIADALARAGVEPVAILLTHGHFDHIGAAAALRSRYGCPIVAGENEAELLSDPQKNLAGDSRGGRFAFKADRLVREGDTVAVGDLTFAVLETPGHTKGGVCYLCGDLLFSGDTLFRGSCGRSDFYSGDAAALRLSLQRLAALPEATRVFPGHGPATDIGAERRSNPFLGTATYDDLY